MEKQKNKKKTSKEKVKKSNKEEFIKIEKTTLKEKSENIKYETKVQNSHNGIISFWKFMFCMMIIIYHAGAFVDNQSKPLFSKGNIGVEFFFLVSGFLMTKSALKKEDLTSYKNIGKETFDYLLKKIKKLWPYVLISGIMAFIIINIYIGADLYSNVTAIWDLLLLKMTGLKGLELNGPVWYISSMLLCMLILYPLIRRYKYNFIYIAAPLIVLLGLGYINQNYGSLRAPSYWIAFTYKGNLRAFIELTLGGLLYVSSEKIKKIDFTQFGKFLLTAIEIICFLTPFFMSQFMSSATKYDMVTLMIISIGIMIAFSEQTLEYKFFCNNFSYWLEKLSLTLYLFHYPLRIIFHKSSLFSSMNYLQKLLCYIPSSIVVAIIMMYLMDYLEKNNFFLKKFKKLIVKEKRL